MSQAFRVFLRLLCVAWGVLWFAPLAYARDVPALQGHVNDTAGLLKPDARQRLERRLTEYEQRTGKQFALLTIDTLAGDSIEEFSIRTVESWKLGKKGADDGLLLLIVRDDRKFRIEVGYGLEGEVTDAVSARINRDVLRPAFRRGDYEVGIGQAFEVLMLAASGEVMPESEAPAVPAPDRRRRGGSFFGLAFLLLFFVFPFFGQLFFGRRRRGFGSRGLGIFLGGLGGLSHGRGGFGGGGFGGGGFRGGGGGFGGGGASGSW